MYLWTEMPLNFFRVYNFPLFLSIVLLCNQDWSWTTNPVLESQVLGT